MIGTRLQDAREGAMDRGRFLWIAPHAGIEGTGRRVERRKETLPGFRMIWRSL